MSNWTRPEFLSAILGSLLGLVGLERFAPEASKAPTLEGIEAAKAIEWDEVTIGCDLTGFVRQSRYQHSALLGRKVDVWRYIVEGNEPNPWWLDPDDETMMVRRCEVCNLCATCNGTRKVQRSRQVSREEFEDVYGPIEADQRFHGHGIDYMDLGFRKYLVVEDERCPDCRPPSTLPMQELDEAMSRVYSDAIYRDVIQETDLLDLFEAGAQTDLKGGRYIETASMFGPPERVGKQRVLNRIMRGVLDHLAD